MKVESKFVKSAIDLAGCPNDNLKEVVFLGRSNAGKSSLINALLNRKALAKVSGTPGKTRLMNFFLVANQYRFVDLPGYGFAKREPGELEKWSQFIEDYLLNRDNLVGMILVMDIRRKWTPDEEMLYSLSLERNIPGVLVLTKADKLNKTKTKQAIKSLEASCPGWHVRSVSNSKKTGIAELLQFIYKTWSLMNPITSKS